MNTWLVKLGNGNQANGKGLLILVDLGCKGGIGVG